MKNNYKTTYISVVEYELEKEWQSKPLQYFLNYMDKKGYEFIGVFPTNYSRDFAYNNDQYLFKKKRKLG